MHFNGVFEPMFALTSMVSALVAQPVKTKYVHKPYVHTCVCIYISLQTMIDENVRLQIK